MTNSAYPFIETVALHFKQAYFHFDLSGNKFLYLSPVITTLWNIDQESVLNDPAILLTFVHPDDHDFVVQSFDKILTTRESTELEFRLVLANKKVHWICLSACILQNENSSITLGGFAHDTTQIKAYTHNILKYNNKKNSTLEILSHDLAAPFANIQGSINAIEEQLHNGEADFKQLLSFIKHDALRGSNMIRDFVDSEFLESSQVVLNKERVDIASKIAIMVDNYKERENLISKNFILHSPEKPILMYIDSMKFLQVMNNLVSNAIKFTQDNGTIRVSVEEQEKDVLITVADDGIGIPAKMQPYLFDKFTKARRQGIRGEKTTGLGMSIIKTVVELHNGNITFESTEGAGTTFYIKIPKEPALA